MRRGATPASRWPHESWPGRVFHTRCPPWPPTAPVPPSCRCPAHTATATLGPEAAHPSRSPGRVEGLSPGSPPRLPRQQEGTHMATKKQSAAHAKFAAKARSGKGKVGRAAKSTAKPKRKSR